VEKSNQSQTSLAASPSGGLNEARRCRICGHEGFDVTPGVWMSSKGTFHTINRCRDHDACVERAKAI
jgi:hypothetical protein